VGLSSFNLNNVAEYASWIPQNTEKLLSGWCSAPDPARDAYSAYKPPLLVERG